jgi:hypothetical protein
MGSPGKRIGGGVGFHEARALPSFYEGLDFT